MDDLGILLVNTADIEDEAALAQLGAALIHLWQKLPAPVRTEALDLACGPVGGIQTTEHAKERLERLIRHNSAAF